MGCFYFVDQCVEHLWVLFSVDPKCVEHVSCDVFQTLLLLVAQVILGIFASENIHCIVPAFFYDGFNVLVVKCLFEFHHFNHHLSDGWCFGEEQSSLHLLKVKLEKGNEGEGGAGGEGEGK